MRKIVFPLNYINGTVPQTQALVSDSNVCGQHCLV